MKAEEFEKHQLEKEAHAKEVIKLLKKCLELTDNALKKGK